MLLRAVDNCYFHVGSPMNDCLLYNYYTIKDDQNQYSNFHIPQLPAKTIRDERLLISYGYAWGVCYNGDALRYVLATCEAGEDI